MTLEEKCLEHVIFVVDKVVQVVTTQVRLHDVVSAFFKVFDNRTLASASLVTFKTPHATLTP